MIQCDWTLVTPPTQEPITLDEAKLHCSVTQDDENALIEAYIGAARQAAEAYLSRGLFTQTWTAQFSTWAETFWLPMAAPLQSITDVKYYDGNDALQTLSSSYYVVDTTSEPGCISRAATYAWPTLSAERRMPIQITYVVGWTDVALIPELIKQGMRYHIAASDADRTGAGDGDAGRRAAAAVWAMVGPVYWREPESCRA